MQDTAGTGMNGAQQLIALAIMAGTFLTVCLGVLVYLWIDGRKGK